MILPDDATPKPDGIFGKDRAGIEVLRPAANEATVEVVGRKVQVCCKYRW
jgi:hypothetical protein